MKVALFPFFFLLPIYLCYAQDYQVKNISPKDLMMVKYDQDSTANAVVLTEFGKAFISNSSYNLVYEYFVRIKVFNEKGFDNANVSIVLHKEDANRFEHVSDIEGTTYFLGQSGIIETTHLRRNQIFKESLSKYRDIVKFALPNVQDGCIIEYKYTIESPFIFNFKTWEFQSHIPKIHSEYYAKIPACYNYNVSLKGYQKISKQDSRLEKECFTPIGGFRADCSNLTFIMNDVPAFVEEDFMTSPSNFKSAICFELRDYTNYRGVKNYVTREWKDIDEEFRKHDDFGKQLKKKSLFKELIPPLVNDKTDELDKAKSIYKYFQAHFRWNGFYGKYCSEGIKTLLADRTGNVGDINLALVTALNFVGLKSDPVILSTRENGLVNKLFPVMSNFNYVVCKVDIAGESYMLDATDPLLPFGLLPLRCINDQGRVISHSQSSYWIDLKASQREAKFYHFDLIVENNGKLKGKMQISTSGYSALNKRKEINRFSSVDEFIEDLEDRLSNIKILNAEVNNLNDVENPLIESYEVELSVFDDLDKERFFFNPFLVGRTTSNPFKLNERKYPVDWGAPSRYNIALKIQFPEKFILESQPEPVHISLPGYGGKFLSNVNVDNSILIMNQVIEFNKSVYGADEYPYLKELYNRIIQSQKFDVVFKRSI